ncbi:hypothetical protein GCM10009122_05360 [Fulvivirga kasyanovii]|uniref:DUF3267 domain-containing protein n=1 Tax=Fulvivirga kasyanovii TaxID=396812 RepID=A0ABW9RSN4_9BACT|nr:DUF3267 domain-containing protein [Fulvivirga kasyanovii]MTI27164.1 DUF3267 domain-containing protein [Fulvivirga kasyanovii]
MDGRQIKGRAYTLQGTSVNLLAFLFLIPILLAFALPYILLYGYLAFHHGLSSFISVYFLITLPAGIVAHELLHGAVWAYFARGGFNSVSFGFNSKALAPYCHCKEPLTVKQYAMGGAAPGLLMGILPAIVAIAIANDWLLIFGIFFTWAASGDMMTLWMLRKFRGDQMVSDHPDEIGFYIDEA